MKKMKPSEKLKSDLLRSLKELWKQPETARLPYLEALLLEYFRTLPASTRSSLASSFEARRVKNQESAVEWLIAVSGIFLKDYDGSPLSLDDWREVRDLVSEASGELGIDVIEYAMDLVLEHQAL